MRVVAVVNQKGGVGKTTTTVNLGHALVQRGLRAAVVDLDPQGHLSVCLGIHDPGKPGVDRVLLHGERLTQQVVDVRDGLSLVPAGADLRDVDIAQGGVNKAQALRTALGAVRDSGRWDVVLLDCAPSSGMLVVNAVTAADDVLMPVAGDYLSLTGLARLMLTLKRLQALHDGGLQEWVFFSRFTPRRRLSQEVYAKVAQHFPDKLLCASVQEAAALAECAGVGKTIFEHRPNSRSAREFLALADDLLHERVVRDEQEKASDVA
ncbi:MAG: ParA family protein [Gammaproteobacteria bacterium]|nr:ParA family protein [Gammaproteobacteria bacterium]